MNNSYVVLHCAGYSLCVDSLFFPLDLHFCAEDTRQSNAAELLQISVKFQAFGVSTFLCFLVHRLAADLDLAVTLDCILFDYYCTHSDWVLQ